MFPVAAASSELSPNGPCLEYRICTVLTGAAEVEPILLPALAFVPGRGLRVAVFIDDEAPQGIDLRTGQMNARNMDICKDRPFSAEWLIELCPVNRTSCTAGKL